MSRRDFLWLMSLSTLGLATGCATNPVTGRSQLMLVSEDQEIQLDKSSSPHQFSADYGPLQDPALNQYLDQTGKKVAQKTHRPNMPYSFRGVNATYVNAYAFPGGSIACTRGILLELDNEAELAALLGHELGHVNARHTAQQVSKNMLASMAVGSAAVFAGSGSSALGGLVQTLGGMGAGALLAKYSRDNERQADDLGMEYMVKANYSPKGMVGLMDMLKNQSKHKPSAFEMLFATHPMSDERYRTSVKTAETKYANAMAFPLHRERYMDKTAKLRSQKPAIEAMQEGERAMAKEDFRTAEKHFKKALKLAPNDYAGLVMMSKCQAALNNETEARRYAKMAKEVYPEEAQAYYLSGALGIMKKDFDGAYQDFSNYEKRLAGNPSISFLKGYSLEGMGRKPEAAAEYNRYLKVVQQGEMAQYAYQRLVQWGYIK